jgi:FkbM family methyltransferase
MISYSQNQEDVVLGRLTKFVDIGTYVDVGAGHPVIHNVTYDLYTRNWRGINIEPMAREAALLRELRPADITLQTAVGNFNGTVTLYEAPLENRGSTTMDEALAKRYQDEGYDFLPVETQICTLTSIFEKHVESECHVLKIDVEGAEREVLEGFDINRFRPWVIIVESTLPQSTQDCSGKWEHILLEARYVQTLFDGLNKFYVRDDLDEVIPVMSVPANVFDDWKTSEVNDLFDQAVNLQGLISEMHNNHIKESDNFKKTFSELERYVQSLIERAEQAEKYAKSLEKRISS